MSRVLKFDGLLQESGWITPAWVTLDDSGVIQSIDTEQPRIGNVEVVKGLAIPGFQNAHSHAFQYAMAGLAEIHPKGQKPDDFWSWRETMYNIALSINPEQMEAIACMLYAEMLRHGYTHVAEFHYVHHDKSGQPYSQHAELSERLFSAAKRAGINITLVPIFYQKGGFGKAPNEGQKRFIHKDGSAYMELLDEVAGLAEKYQQKWAPGIHSLRAVEADAMKEVLPNYDGYPIHIHIAEQLKEIEECLAYTGKRPVEWLLNEFNLNENWHLVHATHLNDAEVAGIASLKAHVVLCPTTEGNLGDGIFRLREFQELGGSWSIGTDSHIGIDPKEELRLLDYGQRLISHKRNTFTSVDNGDSGSFGFKHALHGGRMAMGNTQKAFFETGDKLNAVVMDSNYPLLASSGPSKWLTTFTYAGDAISVLGTISNGKWVVRQNRHEVGEEITRAFLKALSELKIRV